MGAAFFFFSLFGVSWVNSFSIWNTLLGWKGYFVGKKHKKVWNAEFLCHLLDVLKGFCNHR